MIRQVSVFIENKPGSLIEVTKIIKDNGINIASFSLADTESFGVLRMIVDNVDLAIKALKEKRISASETDVIAVDISDEPGMLHDLLELLKEFSIEYMYMLSNREDYAGVVLKINNIEEAEKLISENGYRLIGSEIFKK